MQDLDCHHHESMQEEQDYWERKKQDNRDYWERTNQDLDRSFTNILNQLQAMSLTTTYHHHN